MEYLKGEQNGGEHYILGESPCIIMFPYMVYMRLQYTCII